MAFSGNIASNLDPRATDEGGGSRYEALSTLTDMDAEPASNKDGGTGTINNPADPANNKRKVSEHEDNDSLHPSKKPTENFEALELSDHNNDTDDENFSIAGEKNKNKNAVHDQNKTSYECDDIMVIELTGKGKETKLIKDKATILNLLRNSEFGDKFSGLIRRNIDKNEIIIVINDKKHCENLLLIQKLQNNEGDWPIKCRMGVRNPGLNSGVLKGIDPDVNISRIEEELKRNKINYRKVQRISKKGNPTYCVRIDFPGQIPNEILYAEEMKKIEKFHPPSWTLICDKCSKGGHSKSVCTAQPKCPICSGAHERKDCTNKDYKKCANCNQHHTARYGKCEYFKTEKQYMNIRVQENVPRYTAKNIWTQRQEEKEKQDREKQVRQNNSHFTPKQVSRYHYGNLVPIHLNNNLSSDQNAHQMHDTMYDDEPVFPEYQNTQPIQYNGHPQSCPNRTWGSPNS